LKDLYIGAVITIYSRQLKIVDFGDVFTRKALEVKKERYPSNDLTEKLYLEKEPLL